MIYREYGTTGKIVSAVGFGGMRFENPSNIDAGAAVVLHAFHGGINYFDTAPGYCDDKSEIIMGAAIREIKKTGRPFFVSTKSSKAKGSDLRRDLENSLQRLGVDCIDFYHCWCVLTPEDWERRKAGGAMKEILKARKEGLIRYAAISTHLPGDQIKPVLLENHFQGITLGYSAANHPYREEGVQTASSRGLGVVAMNPLGGGVIPANEKAFGYLKVRPEQTMLEAALHFLLSDRRVTVSLVGFRNAADVDGVLAAVDSFRPYTDEQKESIRGMALEKNEHNALCTSCQYCKNCPQGIEVWKFVETANHLFLENPDPPASRLKWHWATSIEALDACTQCRACEEACTQRLPILERFERLKDALRSEAK